MWKCYINYTIYKYKFHDLVPFLFKQSEVLRSRLQIRCNIAELLRCAITKRCPKNYTILGY